MLRSASLPPLSCVVPAATLLFVETADGRSPRLATGFKQRHQLFVQAVCYGGGFHHKVREACSFCRGFPYLVMEANLQFMRIAAQTTVRLPLKQE